ncbi:MAG: cadherin repeat domain-containing protein [Rhodospirillales bacterium]|nr:cadherin repeat domain-containing protein [Rhodospirillales bacterium]
MVGTLTTTDPNVGDTHKYTVDDGRFKVAGGVLQLESGVSLDYEDASSVVVNVTTTDKGGLSYSESFTITVNDTTEAPTDITLSPFKVDENEFGAPVGTLTTIDDDAGDVHTYTVDDNRFEVVGDQLRLTEESTVNYESEPTVTLNVTSTDKQGNSFTKAITVVVQDLNEAPAGPIDVDGSADLVASTATVGTAVGITAESFDPDAGDSFTFSLSNDAGGLFAIDAASGVVTVGKSLDGMGGDHTITVRATDSHGEFSETDFTIEVGEVMGLMAFGTGGIDTFLLDLGVEAVTTLVGFNRANDLLSFAGVADADSSGSVGLNDLFAMVTGVSDFGSGGDIVVDFTTGASVIFQGAGTPGGGVNSLNGLVSNPSAQFQFA